MTGTTYSCRKSSAGRRRESVWRFGRTPPLHGQRSTRRWRYGAWATPSASRPSLPGQRGPVAVVRTRLQPGEPLAAAGAPHADRHLVADQPPAAPGQDGWTPRATRTVLLALPGREPPDPRAVRGDAPADLGAARAGGLAEWRVTPGQREGFRVRAMRRTPALR